MPSKNKKKEKEAVIKEFIPKNITIQLGSFPVDFLT